MPAQPGIGRSSTAERAADSLRGRITDGELPPGTRLSEDQLGAELEISRNTLREAFRLLTHEGLLVHHLYRGVFVRELSQNDVTDLFRLRRILECDAVRSLERIEPEELTALYAAVEDAEQMACQGRWMDVGTANMHFHHRLVALARSPRADAIMQRVLAELRLVFHAVEAPRELYEPYIARNRELTDLLAAGRFAAAARSLQTYLRDSEKQLTAVHRAGA